MAPDMTELIERIKTEPSVLFLGQNYLQTYTGRDPFYEAVNSKLCGGSMPSKPSYENIWAAANKGKPLTKTVFSELAEIARSIPTQSWLRGILSMRWGMVFTSAVDPCLRECVGPDFTLDTHVKPPFKREYMNKRFLHGVHLYGSIDGLDENYPPEEYSDKRRRRRRASEFVDWIYRDILCNCGVLVIDGWDPDQDWLDFLLDNAGDMYYGSIYLFSATPQMEENETIRDLVEDGILTLCSRSFAQMLDELGYLEDYFTASWGGSADEEGKTVTIRSKNGRHVTYITIPLSALDALDSRVTLLDDDLGYGNRDLGRNMRSENFAQYLKQGSSPNWTLCTPEAGFYFERDVDRTLWERAEDHLKKSPSYRHSMMLLEGVSNSGKTSTLINLAMQFRKEHRYPVLFISGLPTQTNFENNLKRFIKMYLTNRQDGDGAWVEKVIIIWDGNVDAGAVRRYERLARDLEECNAFVIGTVYRHEDSGDAAETGSRKKAVEYIQIEATLSARERRNLEQLLESVGAGLRDRFRQLSEDKAKRTPNLFYILQWITKCQYSEEWKSVSALLTRQFYLEVNRTEDETRQALEQFNREKEAIVSDAIVERGIAADWQLRLELYLKELEQDSKAGGGEALPAERAQGSEESKREVPRDEQTEELKALREDIILINRILAMAGQFSVSLPVPLLLHMLGNDGPISKRNLFINDVLAHDSLVAYERDEQGYPYVQFRHPSEAEQYIVKNFGEDPEKRQGEEVKLLKRIIRACRWDKDEAYDVIALVRCFGPNSAGKYSDSATHGKYWEYRDSLKDIAQCLRECAGYNPEAVLVYAHFMRESICDEDRGDNGAERLRQARTALRSAIENYDRSSSQQYNRLLVELCSNLVASMPRSRADGPFEIDTFHELESCFYRAVSTWVEDNRGTGFSTNSLLDIWLNAVCNFHSSFASEEAALKDPVFIKALTDSLNYIDMLFNISDDFNSTGLLEKINKVYAWTGSDAIRSLGQRFAAEGKDTYLYLTARRCWLTDAPPARQGNLEASIRHDLYLMRDDADDRTGLGELLSELRPRLIRAAEKAIAVLEKDEDLIRRSRSSRCLNMLIRAKWLCYTGQLPLASHQRPAISMAQWYEIYDLCKDYEVFSQGDPVPQVGPRLLQAVYLWSFTKNVTEANEIFSNLRRQMNDSWFVERIGLCSPGTDRLLQFNVVIQRAPSGSFRAKIARVDGEADRSLLERRYGIHVSDFVLSYLFDGQEPRERYNISKPVILWFNVSGPTLGCPPASGKGGA